MSATTQLTTFSDLYTDLQNRVRVTTGVTATENQAKRYINIALLDMHIGFGEKFSWAERSAVLRTHASYTTGTVSITTGSTTLTGSDTAWDTNNSFSVKNARAGGKVNLGGSDVYEVSAVGSDTSITLTTAYIGDDLSGASYTYFEDEYDLADDFLRPVDLLSFSDAMKIDLISRKDFRRAFPRNNTIGKPKVACIIDRAPSGDTSPRRRVVFFRPADTNYLIPYNYVTSKLVVQNDGTAAASLENDDDEPIVPLAYRHAILTRALYWWYRDKKDDDRTAEVGAEWTALMSRLVGDNEIGQNRPRFMPRTARRRNAARRPWLGTGPYSTGTAFDQLRD